MTLGLGLAALMLVLMALAPTENVQATSQTGVSTDGNGGEVDIAAYSQVRATLDVTTADGTTPTLDVTVQAFDQGSGGWVDTSDTFTQVTGSTTTETIDLSEADDFGRIRFKWTTGGTNPSYDFTIGVAKKSPDA